MPAAPLGPIAAELLAIRTGNAMLNALRSFIADLSRDGTERRRFSGDDHRLASAALLFHVIAIDGTVAEAERARLHDLLKQRYGLDEAATADLMREAEIADQEAVDLFRFTQVLKERVDEADREAIIAMMWDLVFQDGALHEFEDNTIWRVAELLGVSSETRLRLKRQVRGSAVG